MSTMALADLVQGDTSYYYARLDAYFPDIVCEFHNGNTQTGVDGAENPVMSEAVGYQPDCLGCKKVAGLTMEHIAAVEGHDQAAQALFGKADR